MPSERAPGRRTEADETSVDAAAALFELLSDETRVKIVYALYRERQSVPSESGLTFSTLRQRIGVRDTGRFNYHLRRLRGSLVDKRDADGTYVLTPTGCVLGRILVDESTPAAAV